MGEILRALYRTILNLPFLVIIFSYKVMLHLMIQLGGYHKPKRFTNLKFLFIYCHKSRVFFFLVGGGGVRAGVGVWFGGVVFALSNKSSSVFQCPYLSRVLTEKLE